MKLKKFRGKNIYLIIIFISISFFCSLGFGTLQSMIIDRNGNGISSGKNSVYFNIKDGKSLSAEDFMKSVSDVDNISLEKVNIICGSYTGKAIYFDSNSYKRNNMISGRFFENYDFAEDEPKAVVGKNVTKIVETDENGTKYIQCEGIKYKIIGVMGYEDRESSCDYQFIVNFNSYIKSFGNLFNAGNMCIDSNENFNILNQKIKNINDNVKFDKEDSNKQILVSNNVDSELILKIIIIIVLLIFLNVFNITIQWVLKKKKEIGIKKAFGGTNFKIAWELILENQKLSIISFIIGYIIYAVVIKLNILKILGIKLYVIATICTLIFTLLISLITSIVAMRKVFKIAPSIVIKGGKR